MSRSIQQLIQERKSVRTFNETPLSSKDRAQLQKLFALSDNPFDIPVEFKLLNGKEADLSSPVIVGSDEYVAAKIKIVPYFERALGYSFEKFCLLALEQGLGTVMLAGTLNRAAFEKAMDLKEDESMPVASPIGYPASRRSFRERMMRKGIKADERLPFETIFFDQSFDQSLSAEKAGIFKEALEMLRLAPSAANKQPWRVVVDGNKVHFYENKGKGTKENKLGDIHKVDMGIALAHFDLTLKEAGVTGNFIVEDPGIRAKEGIEYILTYKYND